MIFDDVVVEDKGVWTQMCRQCANELGESYFWDDIPIDDLICGVKNCQNKADYYMDVTSQW